MTSSGSYTCATSGGMPFRRYSTALSGLLKEARRAFSTSALSYPIAMICSTVLSNSGPEIIRPPAAAPPELCTQLGITNKKRFFKNKTSIQELKSTVSRDKLYL